MNTFKRLELEEEIKDYGIFRCGMTYEEVVAYIKHRNNSKESEYLVKDFFRIFKDGLCSSLIESLKLQSDSGKLNESTITLYLRSDVLNIVNYLLDTSRD